LSCSRDVILLLRSSSSLWIPSGFPPLAAMSLLPFDFRILSLGLLKAFKKKSVSSQFLNLQIFSSPPYQKSTASLSRYSVRSLLFLASYASLIVSHLRFPPPKICIAPKKSFILFFRRYRIMIPSFFRSRSPGPSASSDPFVSDVLQQSIVPPKNFPDVFENSNPGDRQPSSGIFRSIAISSQGITLSRFVCIYIRYVI
jgi:hypothetical protein